MSDELRLFDVHCHILPGVDDGSRNQEMSLSMLDMAYGEGTRRIVLTPHYMLGKVHYTYDELDRKFRDLQEALARKHPDMTLYLGNEVLFEEGIMDDLKAGRIHTMNGTKYVLVEFNIQIPYQELYDAVRQLIRARYWPVIAHVERYRCLVNRQDLIEELLDTESLLQMNISSISGGFLNESRRWCRKLVREGYISFFATDAHDLSSRAPLTQEFIPWIQRKCGDEDAKRMLSGNAEEMVKNHYIS